jgi:hypothetical protein
VLAARNHSGEEDTTAALSRGKKRMRRDPSFSESCLFKVEDISDVGSHFTSQTLSKNYLHLMQHLDMERAVVCLNREVEKRYAKRNIG